MAESYDVKRSASLAQSAARQSHSQIKPRNLKVVSSILTRGTCLFLLEPFINSHDLFLRFGIKNDYGLVILNEVYDHMLI